MTVRMIFSDYFLIGAVLNRAQVFEEDSLSTNTIKKHINTILPENALKWEPVHPEPGRCRVEVADGYVGFGERYQ
jgi:endo-1,4-beta-xylanase